MSVFERFPVYSYVYSFLSSPFLLTLYTLTHTQLRVDISHCCEAHDWVFYFQYSNILPGLQASIGVTCSYFSHPILCPPDASNECKMANYNVKLQVTVVSWPCALHASSEMQHIYTAASSWGKPERVLEFHNPCVGATHADMQLVIQLDQLLRLHRHEVLKLYTQTVSYVASHAKVCSTPTHTCGSSWNIWMHSFTIYNLRSKHAYTHTHNCNAVPLVWGSLRLPPIDTKSALQITAVVLKWNDRLQLLCLKPESIRFSFQSLQTWLTQNLTGGVNGGVHVTDVTNASRTMLVNIHNIHTHQWDPDLCKWVMDYGLVKEIT